MPVLVIRGTIGSEQYEVRCTDADMEGSQPIHAWLFGELGDHPYSLDTIREMAPRLRKMFGDSLVMVEEPDEVGPETPSVAPGPEMPAGVPENPPAPESPSGYPYAPAPPASEPEPV